MKSNKLNTLLKALLIVAFALNQTGVYAANIYAVKSRSTLTQERVSANLLPAFRYDRNNIELNQRVSLDLLLKPTAMTVTVQVIGAEGTGLGIDNTTLLMSGLKIFRTSELRETPASSPTSGKNKVTTKNKSVTFNLTKTQNQSLLV